MTTGTNQWFVGIIVIVYGQSNAVHMTTTNVGHAANAATSFWNGSAWASPANMAIVYIGNGINDVTGIPVGMLNGAVSAQSITDLSKGNVSGDYAAMMAQVTAIGGDAELTYWQQGESNTLPLTGQAIYLDLLDTLHGDMASDVGRTKAQMPIITSSLGTFSGAVSQTPAAWYSINGTLLNAKNLSSIYFSHSNMDAPTVGGDTEHWDATGLSNSGKRWAQTANYVLGAGGGPAAWFIASGAIVDATHTDVTVTHGQGTDFTPTSSITGFTVTDDNWIDTVTPSAAVRQSATVIRLTHSSLGATRRLRFDYGFNPDITGIPKDNSALQVPLVTPGYDIAVSGPALLPQPTFMWQESAIASGQNQEMKTVYIGPASATRLVIVGVQRDIGGATVTALTLTPDTVNGGDGVPITATKDCELASNVYNAVFQAVVPTGTSITLDIAFSGSTDKSAFTVLTADTSLMNSATAVDCKTATSASATSLTISNLTTSTGGFIFAIGGSGQNTAGQTFTSTVETFTPPYYDTYIGARIVGATASNTAAKSGNNDVTMGTLTANRIGLAAASWR